MELMSTLFNAIERLITEHGSAALMKERLDFIKSKLTENETRQQELETENAQLKTRLDQAEHRARELEAELHQLKSGHNTGLGCDACGSADVRRTGSRPAPKLGVLGVKEALFTCNRCGHVSGVVLNPSKLTG